VLSGFFLGTYLGLSVPAVILGIVTRYVSALGHARVRVHRRRSRAAVREGAPFGALALLSVHERHSLTGPC
jgi:hypothetical protein